MKDGAPAKKPAELAKGQFWKIGRGFVQIVELGNKQVYYRETPDPKILTFVRMLRREAFQRQLEARHATLVA